MPRIILVILAIIVLAAIAAWVNQPPPRPVVVRPVNITTLTPTQPTLPAGHYCPSGLVYIRIGGTEICGIVASVQRQDSYYVVQLANATVWGRFVLADGGQCTISSAPDGGVRLGCNTYIYVTT